MFRQKYKYLIQISKHTKKQKEDPLVVPMFPTSGDKKIFITVKMSVYKEIDTVLLNAFTLFSQSRKV